MAKKNNLSKYARKMIPLLKKNGVVRAGIFGSVARREDTAKSDVDVLVKFKGRKSLLGLAHLEIELEEKLGRSVDVLTYNSLHYLLKERILQEEVRIL